MKDYSELKKLAEAAPSGPWRYWGETANEIFQCSGKRVLIIAHDQSVTACEFIAAANPAAVLALIAEIESLKKDAARYRTIKKDAISDGSLIERLDCNVQPSQWDSYIDSVSAK